MSGRGRAWALSAIAALAIVAHATALPAGFVWLDHAHLEDGLALARPASFPSLFTSGFAGTGYYRPLVSLSLSVDALGGAPWVFHATNLAWHALASALVVLAAEALGLSRRAALFAGALFAVHPLTSLAASAIAFRSESMVLVGLLALTWAHERRRAAIAAGATLLAALSKETGLALAPLFVLALEASRGTRPSGRRRLFAFEASAWLSALALRAAFAPPWRAAHPELTVGEAIGTRLASVAKSAAAIALPVDRTICDAFPVTSWSSPTSIAGAVALALLGWAAYRIRGPALLLLLATLPALQLMPVTRWWSPHYVHVALAFLVMLVAQTLEGYGPRVRVGAGVVVAALSVVSLVDGLRYRDDRALWTPEVAAQPRCREGAFYLGEVERVAGMLEAAARRYEAALAPDREFAPPRVLAFVDRGAALQNLGVVRLEQGRYADAERAFREALEGTREAGRRRQLAYNLAVALEGLGRGDEARAVRASSGR